MINARTLRRQLIWTELDSNASTPANTALLIHPAKNLREGERYIVALRNLRGADGAPLQPSAAFRALPRPDPDQLAARSSAAAPHMEGIFKRLKRAGVKRGDLYLAWDFTVASAHSLSGRLRRIRDDAFRGLGDTQPRRPRGERRVAQVHDHARSPTSRRRRTPRSAAAWRARSRCPATSTSRAARPGSRFRLGPDGLPVRTPGNVTNANFICNIPRSVDVGARRGALSLYGHGLFGSAAEVNSISQPADRQRAQGGALRERLDRHVRRRRAQHDHDPQDLSALPGAGRPAPAGDAQLPLPRAGDDPPEGASSSSLAFRDAGGPLIDTRRLYYSGGSQGGIAGGALTAVAPDFTRSVLIVPAMNYSLLLTRSIDFDPFAQVLYPAYPDELTRPLLLSLIQTLWDRGEPNGYAWHMTDDPYPNTPAHTVLLHMAFGDHQVANVAHRGRGAHDRREAAAAGASTRAATPTCIPFYGIEPITQLPVPRQRAGGVGHRAAARRPRHPAAADHEHAAAARRATRTG